MGEDFLSGTGILIISKTCVETLLHVGKGKVKIINTNLYFSNANNISVTCCFRSRVNYLHRTVKIIK